MKMNQNFRFPALLCIGFLFFGCGKRVDLGSLEIKVPPKDSFKSDIPAPCGPDQKVTWKFFQPLPVEQGAVDLLFVVDSSSSLNEERSRIASAIPAFIDRLAPEVDYRIGVMLGHGGASRYSGRLYAPRTAPLVLNSLVHQKSEVQALLGNRLGQVVEDADEANGEALLYSLNKSLEDEKRLLGIETLGFYRHEAALAVVFITDENDICFPPEEFGFLNFPDWVPSEGNWEAIAYQKYCQAVNPTSVYQHLRQFKGEQPLSVSGIIHSIPGKVPRGGEDSIGHGILELVQGSPNGLILDLSQSDYSTGLASLGNIVSRQLNLLTSFSLDGGISIQEDSIIVRVDDQPVSSNYDLDSHTVTIRVDDAGKSQSIVEIEACKATRPDK